MRFKKGNRGDAQSNQSLRAHMALFHETQFRVSDGNHSACNETLSTLTFEKRINASDDLVKSSPIPPQLLYWADGQPSTDLRQNCTAIGLDSKWSLHDCSDFKSYLCQLDWLPEG